MGHGAADAHIIVIVGKKAMGGSMAMSSQAD
jgi:hypothetical protein